MTAIEADRRGVSPADQHADPLRSQPTLSEHTRVLSQAGRVQATGIKQWTFYRRDERRIEEIKQGLAARV